MKGQFLKAGRRVATVLGASAVLAVLGASAAHAEYVPCETPFLSNAPLESFVDGLAGGSINTTRVVFGAGLSVSALVASGAGTVSFALKDIGFDAPLSSLSLLVTDLDGLWQRLDIDGSGVGSLDIGLDGPAKLFAAVFATSPGMTTAGIYNLRASFAPVPLPAALWLLGSALGGLAFFRRKH